MVTQREAFDIASSVRGGLLGFDAMPREFIVEGVDGGRIRQSVDTDKLSGRDAWLHELTRGPIADRDHDREEPPKDHDGNPLTGREAWIHRKTISRS